MDELKMQTDIGNLAIEAMENRETFTYEDIFSAISESPNLVMYSQDAIKKMVQEMMNLFVKIGILKQEDNIFSKIVFNKTK